MLDCSQKVNAIEPMLVRTTLSNCARLGNQRLSEDVSHLHRKSRFPDCNDRTITHVLFRFYGYDLPQAASPAYLVLGTLRNAPLEQLPSLRIAQ